MCIPAECQLTFPQEETLQALILAVLCDSKIIHRLDAPCRHLIFFFRLNTKYVAFLVLECEERLAHCALCFGVT
jgi:hypothetical protein